MKKRKNPLAGILIHVMKFGGGSMDSAESIKRAVKIFEEENGSIMVVSAFKGMTNMLEEIADIQNSKMFLDDFILFHRWIVKGLNIDFPEMDRFFEEQIARFNANYSRLLESVVDSPEYQKCRANIISMGEDFSHWIMYSYIKKHVPSLAKKMEMLNSREIIRAQVTGMRYDNSLFDQKATKEAIKNFFPKVESFSKKYIIQGYVAASFEEGDIVTRLLGREGSDVTAALLYHCLKRLFPQKGELLLSYVKSFGPDGLKENVGTRKFFQYMYEHKKVIVSKNILLIEDLDGYFQVINFDNPKISFTVALTEPIMKELRDEILQQVSK